MNIKDFQDSLQYLFEGQLTGFIWGHAGIGKSSIIKTYAQSKGWHFFPLYLGTQSDLGDVLGLADFVRDKDGTAVATTFATPEWLKDAIEYCEANPDSGAILFLDEFNRARRDVLNGMFSLALDKTFHTIKLPKNCHIIAAGNPPTEEYYVTDVNETALMARFVHIKLEPTVEEWFKYAEKKDFEPSLISFIQEQPGLLEDAKSDFKLPIKVDRRAYERLNTLFKLKTPDHLLAQLMAGIIGIERTVAYQAHLQNAERPLEPSDLLDGKKVERIIEWSKVGDTKAALLTKTIDLLQKHIEKLGEEKTLFTESQADHLLKFLQMIPKEHAYKLLRNLMFKSNTAFDTFTKDEKVIAALVPLVKEAKGAKENDPS